MKPHTSQPYKPSFVTSTEILQIALETGASVSSVRSVFKGQPVRGRVSGKILDAIERAGFADLVAPFLTDEEHRAEVFAAIREGRTRPYEPRSKPKAVAQ